MEERLFSKKNKQFRTPHELSGMMLDVLQDYVPHLKSTLTDSNTSHKEIMRLLCAISLKEQKGKKASTKENNAKIYELADMAGGIKGLSPLINESSVNGARENIETLKLMMLWSSYTLTRIQKIFDETAGFIEETDDIDGEFIIEDAYSFGSEDETEGEMEEASDTFIFAKNTTLASFEETALKGENYGEDLNRFFKGEERCARLQELEANLLMRSANIKAVVASILIFLAVCLIAAAVMASIMTAGALSPTLMAGIAASNTALLAIASITATAAVASGYTGAVFFKQHSSRTKRANKLRTETSNYRRNHIKEGGYDELDPGTESVKAGTKTAVNYLTL